ncbi:neuronal acetylcholine receptor subunit alpha-7 isoform X2 [Nematostella vectensis]|uniref:neuronal acetylcholine receptor subunit alpha-7 isoform X2 n=1 Tax=Nematostella vectensis TaxID=45351 RepID=UPI0020776DF8|nr:neuronal acetylcholine receptor subunit alpha-7 isoform X2 [Nematostella vectensis]
MTQVKIQTAEVLLSQTMRAILVFVVLVVGPSLAQHSNMPSYTRELTGNETDEERLFRFLFQGYKERRLVTPLRNRSEPITVVFSAHLLGLAKVNEKEQSIKTHLWIKEEWYNPFLMWNPEEFGNITEIIVPANMIWVPDIILYNNADDKDEGVNLFNTKVIIAFNGNNTWRSPAIYNTMCVLDVKYFPFDEQTCDLVFASWTRDISKLNLVTTSDTVPRSRRDSKLFQENEEWRVMFAKMKRYEVIFDWSEIPVADVTISVRLQRRTYYYVMNLILPCTLIACTIFLEFILPAESGERVGLGITILLSMAVFQELTSEKLPSSSEHFPLLAMYYSVSIMEIGTALAATCIILNFYHRKTKMPPWFRKVVLVWLAPMVKCKPRYTTREILDAQNEESVMKMIAINKNSDIKRNEVFEFDRDSIEFDMDLLESNNQCRANQKDQLAPNGSVAANGSPRRRQRGGQDEDDVSVDHKPSDPIMVHQMQLSDRLNEEIRRKEWQDAAQVLDRVLLVVSIVIGSTSAAAIFLQSPRIRELLTP